MILYKQGLKGVRTIPNCQGGEPLELSHGDTWRTYPKQKRKERKILSESMYYDVKTVNQYNCLFNFLHGARGIGKSFSLKKTVCRKFS